MQNLQKKSHEVLIKILNNIGIVGAILAAIADIICVIIFVVGVRVEQNLTSTIIFSVINALIGILINILLRYQGQKYAELENEELCTKFYKKKIEIEKKHLSMTAWQIVKSVQDFVVKGCTTVVTLAGIIYISIEGSKNPIQILITIATLVLFACFGLINMNSAYCRFYKIQIPLMELKLKEKENKENGNN